ncbi:MAG: DUF192 domain-containing protein [Acidobacteriota bacterium]
MAQGASAHFLTPVLTQPAQWGLRIERTGQWLIRTLEMASDSHARRKGLLGRDALAPDEGMVIVPTQGIHTFGMRFPLDIVGVSRDGIVVKIKGAVPPRRLVFALRAFAILETAGGVVEHAGLTVGDRLVAAPRP